MYRTVFHPDLRFVFLVYISCLFLALSCSDEDDIADPIGNYTCEDILFSSSSGYPVDSVYVTNLPDDLGDNVMVEFNIDGNPTEVTMALEASTDNRKFFYIPFHPASPLKGGTVDVMLIGSELQCGPFPIEVLELPEADGYTRDVAIAMKDLLLQRMDFLQVDTTGITGDLSDIRSWEVPFALLYNLLTNPQSDIALIPFLDTDDVHFDGDLDKEANLEFADRLLARAGLLELIQEDILSWDDRVPNLQENDEDQIELRSGQDCEGLDAEEVGRQLRVVEDALKYLDPNSVKGKKLQQYGDGALYAGLVPGFATASSLAGMSIFLYGKMYEGISGSYVNTIDDFKCEISPTTFIEETACNQIAYKDARIFVSNVSWSVDRSLWQSLFELGELGSSLIPWSSKLQSFSFDISTAMTSQQLGGLADAGFFDGNTFTVDQSSCGPIYIDDNKYTYAFTDGEAFSVDEEAMLVTPEKAGEVTLEIGARAEFFGGQIASITVLMKTSAVMVNWKPDGILRVKPGDPVNLKVELANALNKEITYETEEGALQYLNFEDNGVEFGGIHNLKLTTPTNKELYPFDVTVTHNSDMCLRGKEGAEPRMDVLTIEAGIIVQIVTQGIGCLAPDETRQYEAVVTGENQEVTWGAFDESWSPVGISSSGLFTAPDEFGVYYIVATSVADMSAADTVQVEVENCDCYWNIIGPGVLASGNVSTFNRSSAPGSVVMVFDQNPGNGDALQLSFLEEHLPGEGETRVVQLSQEDGSAGEWIFQGSLNNISVQLLGPAPLDFENMPRPGATDLVLEMTLEDHTLTGSIAGTVIYQELSNPEEEIINIELPFKASEFDIGAGLYGCE